MTARFRCAARSSPAFIRTSARSCRSRSATRAALHLDFPLRDRRPVLPSGRSDRAGARRRRSGCCPGSAPSGRRARASGWAASPACCSRPAAASTSSRTALSSGFSASARATSSSTVTSPAVCARAARARARASPINSNAPGRLARPASAYRTGTVNFVDPLPAGPSQLTVTCRSPLSGKLIVPR